VTTQEYSFLRGVADTQRSTQHHAHSKADSGLTMQKPSTWGGRLDFVAGQIVRKD
jgi:hypothetical protein